MSGRGNRDREVAAVTFNLKEQRCLEKALATLALEETYSLKLLHLHHRLIKVHHRRLKDRVSSIKSHLTAEEISKLRRQEAEGTLRPKIPSVHVSAALKIAAAARRLKISTMAPRAASAMPSTSAPSRSILKPGAGNPPPPTAPARLRRSNSVTGVFIDAPDLDPNLTRRRGSADLVTLATDTPPDTNGGPAPPHLRPATVAALPAPPRSPAPSLQGLVHAHAPFSSHSASRQEGAVTRTGLPGLSARGGNWEEDSVDSNLGDDVFEERRQELLDEEYARAQELETRRKAFIKDVENYVKTHPSMVRPRTPLLHIPSVPQGLGSDSELPSPREGLTLSRRRQQQRAELRDMPVPLTEEEYRLRVLETWHDVNKCRYLRVPDALIDLSGIATLAKDQHALLNAIKTRHAHEPFAKQSVEI